MFRCFSLATLAVLVFASSASADWDSSSKVPLKRLKATGQIRLTFDACPLRESEACIEINRRPVTIFLPTVIPAWKRALVYYHELGHAFDALLMTDADRRRFQVLMGNAGQDWYPPEDLAFIPNISWPSEQFAEAFMLCARLGPRSRSELIQGLPEYDWSPSVRQHQQVCRAIVRLAR